MGVYDDIVREGVAIADETTASLQDDILHYAWIADGDFSEPTYAPAILRKAIVEEKEYQRRLSNGQEITQRAAITIPRPIAANGAANRREPVDPRDKFVLPSGFTGPILNVNGVTDPKTHAPYMFEIILG
jgi:hypothetical protein